MNNWNGRHLSYGLAKLHKITLEQRIWLLVHKVKQYDKAFNALNQNDIDESFQRINFFIRDEQNLELLDDYNFKLLINLIETFYKTSESESLVDWNYRVNIFDDYIKEETIARIAKEESIDPLNNSFTYQRNANINFTNENDEETIFSIQNKDETVFSNQNDFCDVKLACEDKQIKTHKRVISSPSPEQIYNNISEELLKEIFEEISEDVLDEIEECSSIIYENVSEVLLSEICKELYDEILGEMSNKISKELCDAVSSELCEEICLEILTDISKMSEYLYEGIFEELAKEVYDELCDENLKDIYNKMSEELCKEISDEVSSDQCNEIVGEMFITLHDEVKTFPCTQCEFTSQFESGLIYPIKDLRKNSNSNETRFKFTNSVLDCQSIECNDFIKTEKSYDRLPQEEVECDDLIITNDDFTAREISNCSELFIKIEINTPISIFEEIENTSEDPVIFSKFQTRGNHSCNYCAQHFQNENFLETHVKFKHEDTCYKKDSKSICACDICKKIFMNKNDFKIHMQSVHENKRAIFPCKVCSKFLFSIYDLKRHIKSRHMSNFGNKEEEINLQEFIHEKFFRLAKGRKKIYKNSWSKRFKIQKNNCKLKFKKNVKRRKENLKIRKENHKKRKKKRNRKKENLKRKKT